MMVRFREGVTKLRLICFVSALVTEVLRVLRKLIILRVTHLETVGSLLLLLVVIMANQLHIQSQLKSLSRSFVSN